MKVKLHRHLNYHGGPVCIHFPSCIYHGFNQISEVCRGENTAVFPIELLAMGPKAPPPLLLRIEYYCVYHGFKISNVIKDNCTQLDSPVSKNNIFSGGTRS